MTRRARDVLLDILRDEGVTHVFGNPGSTEMPLMDALVDAPDIRYILGLQEATAVGMADGWALASGRAAFVNLHAMGGLGNAMGVLVASKASETPLVVTAGQQDTRHLMTEPWLSGDLVALAEPVTKWAKELRRGEDVGQALRRAFAVCRTPPSGPVFLSLPMDILDQEVSHPTPPASSPPRLGPSPDAAQLAETLAGLDPDRVVVLLGDDLPAAVERRIGRLRRGRRLSGLGNAAHFPHRLSVRASVLGGGAEARFRRDARPLQDVASDRAGRRTRVRRLPLSRRRAGARGRRGPAYRRQPGGVRARTARPHGAPRRHRTDPRRGGGSSRDSSSTRTRSRRGSPRARRIRARPGKRRGSIFWPKAPTRR